MDKQKFDFNKDYDELLQQNIEAHYRVKFQIACHIGELIILHHVLQYFLSSKELENFTKDKENNGFLMELKFFIIRTIKDCAPSFTNNPFDEKETEDFVNIIKNLESYEQFKQVSLEINKIAKKKYDANNN